MWVWMHDMHQMVQEMCALSALEDVNDDDMFELNVMESGVRMVTSSVTPPRLQLPVPDLRQWRFNSLVRLRLIILLWCKRLTITVGTLHTHTTTHKPTAQQTGDAISNLISMNCRHVINSTKAHSINHLMVQLHAAPSSHSLQVTPEVSRNNSLVDN